MPNKPILPLWLELALLLATVGICTFVGGVVIFEFYWLDVLSQLPESTRILLEEIRPSPRLAFNNERPSFRPGVLAIIFGAVVIVVSSILIARRILAPIHALERGIERISGRALALPNQKTSEFSQMLHQVESLAQKLEQSEDARRFTNAAIAHELRTPLTALRARVESLEFGVYPLGIAEISKLHPSLDLLERLVEDLQTLSLADAGKLHLEPQNLDLKALLLEVSSELQIPVQISPSQSYSAHLDPKRMRQVLYNLLENSKRYAGQDPCVFIRLKYKHNKLLLYIADNGAGVPELQLSNLFTPFYRLEPSRSREHGGSGLGLAVVQVIIQAHGGAISAQIAKSGGLEFELELPNS